MTIALSPHASREVRQSFEQFADKVDTALFDDLRILSTEVVTNAVRHSGRPLGDPIEVVTTFTATTVRVEVTDQGEGVDSLVPRAESPPSGLRLVELLTNRWSSEKLRSFLVWFEIDTHSNAVIRRATA